MRKVIAALLLVVAGWVLGWYMHERARPLPVPPVVAVPEQSAGRMAEPVDTAVPGDVTPTEPLQHLLAGGDDPAAVEYYEGLLRRGEEAGAARARALLLTHARALAGRRQYTRAQALLERLLVAAWRDVEVRSLLAEVHFGLGDVRAAIDQLYLARGHAWSVEQQAPLSRRIRVLATAEAEALERRGDQAGLLELYLHLSHQEPDHAAYFIGLAGAQLALGDTAAAVRSLQLVVQDPGLGAQASALLAELQSGEAMDEAAAATDAGVSGIALRQSGNHFLVEARPGQGRSLELLIDTGASLTIVTPAALERHGIRYTDTGRSGVFNTANGRVQAPVYRLDRLAVGDWEVRDLEIGVLELGSRSDIDGLLGMNFLQHFQFFIDQNRSLLRLSLQAP